jgi:hypothetical protein
MSHFDLDLDERASVAVTLEAVSSLVDFYDANPDTIGFSPPLVLGRDIRRQLGDECGFGIWSELMDQHEPPLTKEESSGRYAHAHHDRRIPSEAGGGLAGLRPWRIALD